MVGDTEQLHVYRKINIQTKSDEVKTNVGVEWGLLLGRSVPVHGLLAELLVLRAGVRPPVPPPPHHHHLYHTGHQLQVKK